MIRDIGASRAKICTKSDYVWTEAELVDGYWVIDMAEDVFYDQNYQVYVYLYGQNDSWEIGYINGTREYLVQLHSDNGRSCCPSLENKSN